MPGVLSWLFKGKKETPAKREVVVHHEPMGVAEDGPGAGSGSGSGGRLVGSSVTPPPPPQLSYDTPSSPELGGSPQVDAPPLSPQQRRTASSMSVSACVTPTASTPKHLLASEMHVEWRGGDVVESDEDSVKGAEDEDDPIAEQTLRLTHAKERLRERINEVLGEGATAFAGHCDLTVSIATFNVGEKIPRSSPHYRSWLLSLKDPNSKEYVDIVAVGLQEVDMSAGSIVLEEFPAKARVWEGFIASQLEQHADYAKVHSISMSGLLLVVFAKEATAARCVNISSAVVRIGERGLANKGGVGVRLTVGGRRILFLNTHLDAHTEKLRKRNRGYERIISELRFPLPPHADDPMDLIFNKSLMMDAETRDLSRSSYSMSHLEHSLPGGGTGTGGSYRAYSQAHPFPSQLSAFGHAEEVLAGSSSSSPSNHSAGQDFGQCLFQLLALLPAPVAVLVKEEIRESMELDRRHAMSGIGASALSISVAANQSVASNMGGNDATSSSNDSIDEPILSPRQYTATMEDDPLDEECIVHNFDYVFWFGDLNYRLWNIPNTTVRSMVAKGELTELLQYDQLRQTLATSTAFGGFEESAICFPPTYKFDPGTHIYDTSSKQRAPSWTDRVLYLTRPQASFPPAPQNSSTHTKGSSSKAVPMAYSSVYQVGSFYSCEDASSFRLGLTARSDHSPPFAGSLLQNNSGNNPSFLMASARSKPRTLGDRYALGEGEHSGASPIPLCGSPSPVRGGGHGGGGGGGVGLYSALSPGNGGFTGHAFPHLNEVAVVDSAPEALAPTPEAVSPSRKYKGGSDTLHMNVLTPDIESYTSHPVLISDHRPVSSKFTLGCLDMNVTSASDLLANDPECIELTQKVEELATRLEQMRFGTADLEEDG